MSNNVVKDDENESSQKFFEPLPFYDPTQFEETFGKKKKITKLIVF